MYKLLLLVFAFLSISVVAMADDEISAEIEQKRQDIIAKALDAGVGKETIDNVFNRLKYVPKVINLDRKQPEFALSFENYMARLVTEARVKNARKYYFNHLKTLNYTGSIKDRVALRIIRRAYESGALKEGDIICEGTSGNTGIAISAIGAFLGNPVTIFMPDWMTKERVYLIKGMGANIRLISQEEGGLDVMLPLTEQYAKEHGAFQTKQFANKDNVLAHYNGTATEIVEQLAKFGKKADGFVAGIGTGGTFVGIASYLKDNVAGVKVYPLEPDLSLLLSGKMTHSEQHLIHGIGDGFIPDIIKDFKFDEAIAVNDKDSVAVQISIALMGVMALWLGIMRIAQKSGMVKLIAKAISPVIKRIFPDIPPDGEAATDITMNVSANALGLNNAATPFGLKAMQSLQKLNPNKDKSVASDSMCTFLAINTAGIQFIPASVMAVLAAAGSDNPAEIIAPCIVTTSIVLVLAVIIVKILERLFPEPAKLEKRKAGKNA